MSRLRANSITNKTANGAPTATNGLEVTGICTATDFSGQAGTAADLEHTPQPESLQPGRSIERLFKGF